LFYHRLKYNYPGWFLNFTSRRPDVKSIISYYMVGDSKWLWISMATMDENPCGNRVGGVGLTTVWHFIFFFTIVHWIDNFQNCATMNCQKNVNSIPPTQSPHKSSHIARTPIHDHFESPNTIVRSFKFILNAGVGESIENAPFV
jgi:hypothetical protein